MVFDNLFSSDSVEEEETETETEATFGDLSSLEAEDFTIETSEEMEESNPEGFVTTL